MSLDALGWNSFFAEAFAPWSVRSHVAARVATQHRGGFEVWTEDAVLTADVTGRFRHHARLPSDFPAVGDWVAIEPIPGETRALIHAVLPRRTKLSRNAPGTAAEEQVLVTNIDDIFILEPLATTPHARRIARFLTVAAESGANPAVILTKADLCADVDAAIESIATACPSAHLLAVSSVTGRGLDALRQRVRQGRTVVLLGKSGAGKSTLINHLAKEETQFVLPVRESDQKGRHATTSREMVFLPGGGVIIDTPGLRELQLWDGAEGVEATFADIESLALSCRFADCGHETEPDCAVRQAIRDGQLPQARLTAFLKLQGEAAQSAQRRQRRSQADQHKQAVRHRHGARGPHTSASEGEK